MSCGRSKAAVQSPTPAAYYPEQFKDIPLPQYYVRKQATDQVAISFANGNLRHYDITLEETDYGSGAKYDKELILWYDTALISNGWKIVPNKQLPYNARHYKKVLKGQEELLELRTGRENKLGIIRLRFIRK